jgi:hypothetical protein
MGRAEDMAEATPRHTAILLGLSPSWGKVAQSRRDGLWINHNEFFYQAKLRRSQLRSELPYNKQVTRCY